MLFSAMSGFLDTGGFVKNEIGDCTFYHKGLFYLRGEKAGSASIAAFAEEYERSGVLPFEKAFGAFSCVVVRRTGETIFFTDNSNLHCFYVGSSAISDSFLSLVRHERASAFDEDALCEFLGLGGVFFGKTLVDSISTSASDCVYVCYGGTIRQELKQIGDIDEPSTVTDFAEFFQDTAHALSGERVALSLTGGYDSRLVFACLRERLPVDVFISCSDEKDPDVLWAKRVAQAGGATLEIVNVDKPVVNERYVRHLFVDADGVVPCVDDTYMRIHSFMHDRQDKGYTCLLTGDGGPRHKDWYWLQDFPFYRMRHTNLGRFYDQRLLVIPASIPIGGRIEKRYQGMRRRVVRGMRRYLQALNTESYDSLGFHVLGDIVKPLYTAHSRLVTSYAPLWELELVRYSFHLPRRERFFYNSMRKVTTAQSKSIARTPTVYGTTASSERRYLARDVFFQGVDYTRKAARLLGRNVLHRNLFVGHPSGWSAEREVRGLKITEQAVMYCEREGFVRAGTTAADLSYAALGRVVQVYLIAEALSPSGDASPVNEAPRHAVSALIDSGRRGGIARAVPGLPECVNCVRPAWSAGRR